MTTNLQSLSLTQLFGEGTFQDASVLIIQKASLLRLSPSVNNAAESLLVAILITALNSFQGTITDENNQSISDENNQSITFDNSEAFELIKLIEWKAFQILRNNQKYINNQIIVEGYTIDVTN
ncbi:hypothetical protein [Nostoc sp. NMS4]|uniref:hypothetical protein n=1 Tax=Nostoc sp. NMS4 TaxID=2815390 RepID=UPI0025F9BC52|nr:hypothetical protein [Nostoc sp. NMS4]MBN3924002.1 hypothetical protein [Nostoc sp. NMS4]